MSTSHEPTATCPDDSSGLRRVARIAAVSAAILVAAVIVTRLVFLDLDQAREGLPLALLGAAGFGALAGAVAALCEAWGRRSGRRVLPAACAALGYLVAHDLLQLQAAYARESLAGASHTLALVAALHLPRVSLELDGYGWNLWVTRFGVTIAFALAGLVAARLADWRVVAQASLAVAFALGGALVWNALRTAQTGVLPGLAGVAHGPGLLLGLVLPVAIQKA